MPDKQDEKHWGLLYMRLITTLVTILVIANLAIEATLLLR